ncbi:MAG TPA: diadenylate cyclase CdaA [Salinivirgaceae bacterium]|nr:diadenylate cyclase CdaA [Salinivirgaceae bacterium]
MISLFITFDFFDFLDILIVAILFYEVYQLIKGTIAINIFVGIFLIYLFWQIVIAFKMELLNTIIGQFMGVGVLAVIIIFQPEIRQFLLMLGNRDFLDKKFNFDTLFNKNPEISLQKIDEIAYACANMSGTKTGALIVISEYKIPKSIIQSGDILNAEISARLLENIFFKNSPLHDGAVIVRNNRVLAARCILPLSSSSDLPPSMGMRHRAAIGITEVTNVFVIVVSEETGKISAFKPGEQFIDIDTSTLKELLADYLGLTEKEII